MKKLFYIFAITLFTSMSLVSCTEENITPTQSTGSGSTGGSGSGDPGSIRP